MNLLTSLDDLIGISQSKLGFYQELRQKVEQLRESNQELEKKRGEVQAILDGITDLMLVLSEDLRIQRVNHVFTQLFPDVNPLGRYCFHILCDRDEPCPDCPALRSLDRRQLVKDVRIQKVGEIFRHYEIVASPLESEPTGERKVLLFKRDVTLEKQYQAQFYQAEKMATVGSLAAGVAHEINNPLASILGFAQGLKRRNQALKGKIAPELLADFQEYTETIIREALRCRDIARVLLTFSRPIVTHISEVDLNRCVTDTLLILKHHLKKHYNLHLTTDLDTALPPVRGDESQLKQVIINLLTNALDASETGGVIIISTRAMENAAELVIEDSGSGIPLEHQDKLFEPFFTTKPVGEGIGIGLATCYAIVKSHHGEISVVSVPGQGASFKVSLPGIKKL
ncbi:MAG: PAS domain-containing protein [Desulfobulbaceae bacterium]|jgi:signal transduction histidine kinase|nr:PAS domain-containing protein [Desulfobulbaceae bacterium]